MDFVPILIIVFAVLTAAALFIGIGGFLKGGEFNRKYGNKMMQLRVGLQAITLLLLLLMFLLIGRGG